MVEDRRLKIAAWSRAFKGCHLAGMPHPPLDSEYHFDIGGHQDDIWDWRHGQEGAIRWRITKFGELKHLVVYATDIRWRGIGPRKKREQVYGPVSGVARDKAIGDLHSLQQAVHRVDDDPV